MSVDASLLGAKRVTSEDVLAAEEHSVYVVTSSRVTGITADMKSIAKELRLTIKIMGITNEEDLPVMSTLLEYYTK
jgi:hypothetical protein